MTPESPTQERPQVQPPVQPGSQSYMPSPVPWQSVPAGGWAAPYMPPPAPLPVPGIVQVPTPPQRLALAIASLALFIPLLAIAANIAQPLDGLIPPWLGIVAALIGILMVSLTVVAVNVVFNWDALRRKR